MNIVLVGMRCCGKSSISKLLGKKLGLEVVDIDNKITEELDMSITDIIDKHGWEFFRKKEKEVTLDVAKRNNIIISTGGGTVVDDDNRKALKQNGKIIYLYITPKTSIQRQLEKSDRPALTNKENLTEEVEKIYKDRNGIYCQSADIIFKRTDDREKDTEQIIEQLSLYD